MCMVLMMAGIKEKNVAKAWEFVSEMAPIMSRFNDEGIGYVGMTKEGALVSEKWVKNKQFGNRGGVDKELFGLIDDSVLIYEDEYAQWGDLKDIKNVAAIMLHTRKSTNTINISNTHPFIRENTALIHNGVISNHHQLTKITSTCDSEVILNEYFDNEVNKDPTNLENVTEVLKGYYAVGVLSTDAENKPVMDVFKNNASLHVTFIKEIGVSVFCTSDIALKEALTKLGWEIRPIYEFAKNHYMRLDVVTGKSTVATSFPEPKEEKSTYNSSGWPNTGPRTSTESEATKLSKEVEKYAETSGLCAIVTEFSGDFEGMAV